MLKLGFIGLGRMGRGMARRILGAGYDLVVFDTLPEKSTDFGTAGARVASSIADACKGRDGVITMLVEDTVLNDVALGGGGLRDSLPPGAIHLVMGTHGVATIRALAAAHGKSKQILVAAPVLGRPDLAASGQLGIVAAGPADAVRRCEPLFQILGRHTFHAGAQPEAANAIKLANNLVLGCAIQAMSEAFSLVRKYGVPPQVFYDVMTEGLFAAPAYKVYGKIIVDETYDTAGSTVTLNLKDADLILAAGDDAGVALPGGKVFRDRLLEAIAYGDGEKDVAVLARERKHGSR